jgi:hypothetical protein
VGFSIMHAQQLTLTRTPISGNTLRLTARALITQITGDAKCYTIWRNGSAYISSQKNEVKGILPPGTYTLKTCPGGSITIYLTTTFQPQNIILWGRQNKLVKPEWEGNYVSLDSPTRIDGATYDGTDGMGIFGGTIRILYFVSPHNHFNPGPKVIGGTGGKTLVGQILPPGVYHIIPGRGTATGIVYGQIVLTIR